MGKSTGFMEYERCGNTEIPPEQRVQNYKEFHKSMSEKKRQEQAARCMDCGVPFCQAGMMIRGSFSGCPLHNLIPEWNDLLYCGQTEEAVRRLLMTNNFPEFTSRVCPALCEKACTCGLYDAPVTVKENENYIIESAYKNGWMQPRPPKTRTDKNVVIVGSGPSGLAAADQLNKRGHMVTVLERSDRIGGLLMYGIPNMKLEKSVIDRRVKKMQAEGVTFCTGMDAGRNVDAERLLNDFDAVILCCGSSRPRDIQAPGRDAQGIHFAVDYLSSVTKSLLDSNLADGNYINAQDKDVVVIGGGDTGNDCVGTAVRQGCRSVIQVEMMPRRPDGKTDYGQEEAIWKFGEDPRVYETTLKEYIQDETGNLCAVKLVQVGFRKNAETGAREMYEAEGTERIVDCQLVLIAAGFTGAQDYVADAFKAARSPRGSILTAPGKYNVDGGKLFTAGDMHRGQSLVVWAIQEGRSAAKEVDAFLMGYSNLG